MYCSLPTGCCTFLTKCSKFENNVYYCWQGLVFLLPAILEDSTHKQYAWFVLLQHPLQLCVVMAKYNVFQVSTQQHIYKIRNILIMATQFIADWCLPDA